MGKFLLTQFVIVFLTQGLTVGMIFYPLLFTKPLTIKTYFMTTNLSLDDMILQYSENPFSDEKMFKPLAFSNPKHKQNILSRLLLIASNLFSSKEPQSEPSCYKRRYGIE